MLINGCDGPCDGKIHLSMSKNNLGETYKLSIFELPTNQLIRSVETKFDAWKQDSTTIDIEYIPSNVPYDPNNLSGNHNNLIE